MILRIAEEHDISDILEIYKPYILNTAISFEYEVPSLEEFTGRFQTIYKQFPFIVCEIDSILAGYAYASSAFERAAYQWDAGISVYIHEAFHRLGIGSRFYYSIEQFLRLQGYYNLYACVTEGNEKSHLFHKNRGFSKIGIFQNSGYKFGQWHDVVWYEKSLSPISPHPAPPTSFLTLQHSIINSILNSHERKTD